jgi:predicted ABC-type transport system involved in lysophospholipase L1 biosynthesis ATPase subunit
MTTTELLVLRNVSKRYPAAGDHGDLSILQDVSLTLNRGDRVAITGPSGSGKSTLLNLMGALDRATEGEVLLAGTDLGVADDKTLSALRNRQVGFVFQDHHLLPQCSVLENVLVPTLVEPGQDPAPRATALLERVGLGARLHHRPGQLSGGECQRVAVVRAMINQPGLLLADEPTGSLDAAHAVALADLLLELNQEEQVALVVVTHSEALAQRMNPVYRLHDGRLAPAP